MAFASGPAGGKDAKRTMDRRDFLAALGSAPLAAALSWRTAISAQKNFAGWAVVERVWHPGDKLILSLSPKLHLCPIDTQHPRRCAVKYGPVLLAQEARFTFPLALGKDEEVAAKLKRQTADPQFIVDDAGGGGQKTGEFRPFYQIWERLPYRVYFDLDVPRFL